MNHDERINLVRSLVRDIENGKNNRPYSLDVAVKASEALTRLETIAVNGIASDEALKAVSE